MKLNIRRDFYTLASVNEDAAELTLYGDIVESRPIDWWTDEPVEGNFIVLDEFLEDLNQVQGCKKLTIRMNSYGGDAGVSVTIHNRLRELSRNGTEITCVVDGVAMSGGSLIMCAADQVGVNPSSLVMIHKCWCFIFGGYNADELRHAAESNDAYDRAQAAIYARKTGMEEDRILEMMAETTYLTGLDAVNFGFADYLLEDAEETPISASADRRFLFAQGRKIHLAPGMTIPEDIPTITPEAAATTAPDVINTMPEEPGEGGNAMTLEELRQEHPELVSEIEASVSHNDAVEAERQRIREIDQIAGLFSDALVEEAKYGSPCTAQEMSYRAAQQAAQQGRSFLASLETDGQESGAQEVGAVAAPADTDQPMTDAARMAAGEAMAKKLAGNG